MAGAEPMELTNFHLGRGQKQALRQRAAARGTNLAEEIRSAVDAYLAGITTEELELLDVATRRAQADIADMNEMLEHTNRRLASRFAELERLHGGPPDGRPGSPPARRPARGRA